MISATNSHKQSDHTDWTQACQALQQQGEAYCLATVVAEVGSLPRGTGSKMVISADQQFATLGGGRLEFETIRLAREGIEKRRQDATLPVIEIERFSLAADLGQCCGGAAQIMFEFMNAQRPRVAIFGAGHVCHSLCKILSELPCSIMVLDSRPAWLDSVAQLGATTRCYEDLSDAVAELPANAHLVIMTHEHSQDYDVARKALERECFPFIGMIGSANKKARFEQRFNADLTDNRLLSQLTCPIGDPSVKGKLPMQVAVSIAVQLMARFDNGQPQVRNGVDQPANIQQWDAVNQLRQSLLTTEKASVE